VLPVGTAAAAFSFSYLARLDHPQPLLVPMLRGERHHALLRTAITSHQGVDEADGMLMCSGVKTVSSPRPSSALRIGL